MTESERDANDGGSPTIISSSVVIHKAVETDMEGAISDNVVEEEYWPMMMMAGSSNNNNNSIPLLQSQHETHTLCFTSGSDHDIKVIKYKAVCSHNMTPLDMIYEADADGGTHDDDDDDDKFYDGTGNLLWLAAVCFANLLAHHDKKSDCLQKYLPNLDRSTTTGNENVEDKHTLRICELGCGTGVGGIAMLLFHLSLLQKKDHHGASTTTTAPSKNSPMYHVVFTDNDAESLDLCRDNCVLNQIDPHLYSHRLLWWGKERYSSLEEQSTSISNPSSGPSRKPSMRLEKHSFDTVLAADVVYDLKMIRPLLETAQELLKIPNGYFILSHVPRFCLPKNSGEEDNVEAPMTEQNSDVDRAYLALEQHIIDQAKSVGLILLQTIHPHEALATSMDTSSCTVRIQKDDVNANNDNAETQVTLQCMEEAHAVVFVFAASDKED